MNILKAISAAIKDSLLPPSWGRAGVGFLLLSLCLLFCACSETKNLAEGEVLYTGIRKLHYDEAPKRREQKADTMGVITAVAGAYETVATLFAGGTLSAEQQASLSKPSGPTPLTQAQRDSLRLAERRDREAYRTARAEVEGALKHKPNNSLLGSSFHRQPLALGLWIYNSNVHKDSRWGRWMLNNFAATPVYMTTVNPRIRAQVARNTLRNFGYFRGTVSYAEVPEKNPRKARVDYEVHPGPLFHLDSIAYQHFPATADSLVRRAMRRTELHRGAPFSTVALNAERQRLSDLFRNFGYYHYQPSYIAFRADTVQRPLHVQLHVQPSPATPPEAQRQYYIGRIRVNISDYAATALRDSFTFRNFTLAHSGPPRRVISRPGDSVRYSKPRLPLKFRAMARYITLRHGQPYSQWRQNMVQQNLAGMGVFSSITLDYVPRDTSQACDTLDAVLNLRLDRPYDAEFRANIASKSNGLIGPGASFSMSKQNTFRGAETLSLEAHASYEWQTGAQMKGQGQLINSYEYGVSLNLHFPRLIALGLGKFINRKTLASTAYTIDADWMNRSAYFGRVSLGARVTYTYQHHRRQKHELTPFRLNYDMLLNSTDRFDAIVATNQALYVTMRDQFVPSMQYVFTHTSSLRARHRHQLTLTAKEAGNVTSGIYSAFGKPWAQKDKNLFGVPFAQYLKLTAEHTALFPIGRTKTHIATRLFAGAVWSYGNSTMAPYSDLFVIGGANSLRAFGVRTIGPGRYNPARSGYSYIDEMGDLKLEANIEYRFPLVADLHGAIFVDAGNVWLMKPDPDRPGGAISPRHFARDIALGTGLGLRYDLDFLVIRLDVGIGLHAPYSTGRHGYYNMTSFARSLGYHIAIGYPF